MNSNSHWLVSAKKESVLILLPLFLPVFIVYLFRDYFSQHTEVTALWWLVLVLMIDVGHVYSTLFRFYWERSTFVKYKTLLIIIPVVCFALGFTLHIIDSFLFWRILAYAALYHFIRQQYGFLRLYSRKQKVSGIAKWIDVVSVYSATIYPVLYWHLHLTGSLSWFVPNDFVAIPVSNIDNIILGIYLLILAAYLAKEIYFSIKTSDINIPKNGIMLGTYLSWYAGIVLFHGDLAFTLMNVVAHGIPYMGLVWLYGTKKDSSGFSFGWKGVAVFISTLLLLAYFEESLWDILVWKDHLGVFPFFTLSNPITDSLVLSVIVPLLVLPQLTHYVLDGFIWRFSKDSNAIIG
ncbi:hypothetical protein WSM22_38930 [Cytophagales bacterium WSM2-2]|nr:hypothetical protein WSM22_38930 [Cytophagales bacterium WSM2-2]